MNGKETVTQRAVSKWQILIQKETMIHKNGKEGMPKREGTWKEEGTSEGSTGKVLFELSWKGCVCFENPSTFKLAGRGKGQRWPRTSHRYSFPTEETHP